MKILPLTFAIKIIIFCSLMLTVLTGCGSSNDSRTLDTSHSNGEGDANSGKQVFRLETFGNEGFWTDAIRLPQGMMEKHITPLDALKLGINIDSEALDDTDRNTLTIESKSDLSPQNAPMLNDVNTTIRLINTNAFVGIVAAGRTKFSPRATFTIP